MLKAPPAPTPQNIKILPDVPFSSPPSRTCAHLLVWCRRCCCALSKPLCPSGSGARFLPASAAHRSQPKLASTSVGLQEPQKELRTEIRLRTSNRLRNRSSHIRLRECASLVSGTRHSQSKLSKPPPSSAIMIQYSFSVASDTLKRPPSS